MIINVNILLLKMSQLTRLSTSTYVKKIIHKFEYEDYSILKNDTIFNKTATGRVVSRTCMQLPFFANALSQASGDNLDLKRTVKSSLCSWGPGKTRALQSIQRSQRTLNLIQIITRFEMFFLRNFCQTYTLCRHQSLKYRNGTTYFL